MRIMDGYQTEKYLELLMSTDTTNPPTEKANPPKMVGWICPVCGRGLSPFTTMCPCKGWKGWDTACMI